MSKGSTTQRAYTLRLNGLSKGDNTWRDYLWQTHEAVNKGAKVFGDWLLIMRGGLCHTLVDLEKIQKTKNKPSQTQLTDKEKENRRILLALSWLSVESESGAPTDRNFIVATGNDSKESRSEKLTSALNCILVKRGLPEEEIKQWCLDCQDSLSANIRDDAVWVNRSTMFDEFVQDFKDKTNEEFARDKVWDLLDKFFSNKHTYLAPYQSKNDNEETENSKNLVENAGG